ncbi:MAG: hypothetical protein WB615_08445 [Candidatus Tumulicola sp.]
MIPTRLLAAIAAAVALGACAAHKTTIQTREGNATVTTSQDDKSVTVRTSQGTTSIGQGVDTSRLGAPLYPGAQASQPASITTATDTGTSTLANFTTSDAFDKVYRYYKDRLPPAAEKMKVVSANGSVASFQVSDPSIRDVVSVQVSSDKPNETSILITRTQELPH